MKAFKYFLGHVFSKVCQYVIWLITKNSKISSLFQANIHSQICKNVSFWFIFLERVDRNGKRLVQILLPKKIEYSSEDKVDFLFFATWIFFLVSYWIVLIGYTKKSWL
jgi:H+/Cl- antiporter ClcA